jgi:hypothetical protein
MEKARKQHQQQASEEAGRKDSERYCDADNQQQLASCLAFIARLRSCLHLASEFNVFLASHKSSWARL